MEEPVRVVMILAGRLVFFHRVLEYSTEIGRKVADDVS